MVDLKRSAETCDAYVNNSPSQRVMPIDAFFDGLKQPLPPDLVDARTRSTLQRFVRQQAAAICKSKLNRAFAAFQVQAVAYDRHRPSGWPAAPLLQSSAWCAAADCSDVN